LRQFGTNIAEKAGNQNVFIFPPHLTSASALPGETGNPEIASFRLKCCMLFRQKTRNTVKKYHLVRTGPPFSVKTIDWVHQTRPRKEHSILLCTTWGQPLPRPQVTSGSVL